MARKKRQSVVEKSEGLSRDPAGQIAPSQTKVAERLHISRSTVAKYWQSEKKSITSKLTSRKFGLYDLFYVGKCTGFGLIYPKPKFLPLWNCPGCKKDSGWKICWY